MRKAKAAAAPAGDDGPSKAWLDSYADAMTLFKHSAVTDLHYDHETVSGWFDYVCDEKTPCITTARFDGAQRVCLKRCYPGRHQVYIPQAAPSLGL